MNQLASIIAFAIALVVPPQNQACDSSSTHTQSTPVTGEPHTSISVWHAENGDDENVKDQLEANSGVTCDECPNRERCNRRATFGAGAGSTYTASHTTTDNGNQTWTSTTTFSGAYTVICDKCPKILPK